MTVPTSYETRIFGAEHATVMLTLGDHVVATNTLKLLTSPQDLSPYSPQDQSRRSKCDVIYHCKTQPTIKLLEALFLHTQVSEGVYLDTLKYLYKWKYFMNPSHEQCKLKPLFISIINNKPNIDAFEYVVSICKWIDYPEVIVDNKLVAEVQKEIPNYPVDWLECLGKRTKLLKGPAYEELHRQVIATHLKLTEGTRPKTWYKI